MRRILGPTLLSLQLGFFAVVQLLSLVGIVNPFVNYAQAATAYAIIASLLWLEREHLAEFRIDRFTLVLLVLTSFLRTRLGGNGESYILLVFGLSGVAMAALVFQRKCAFTGISPRWLLIGIGVGCLAVVPLAMLELSRFQPTGAAAQLPPRILPFVLRQVVFQLSFTALIEELLFRGFLWGYLQRFGWQEGRAMWTQAIVFWLFHLPQAVFAAHFFLAIPLATFIYTILTKKSKQLGPAVLSHTIIDAITPMVAAVI